MAAQLSSSFPGRSVPPSVSFLLKTETMMRMLTCPPLFTNGHEDQMKGWKASPLSFPQAAQLGGVVIPHGR